MKYPLHTNSKPAVGAEAQKILKAIKEGTSITNDAAQSTIKRIIAIRDESKYRAETIDKVSTASEDNMTQHKNDYNYRCPKCDYKGTVDEFYEDADHEIIKKGIT